MLSSLLDCLDQGVCLSDASGKVVSWNVCAERLTGISSAEAVGGERVEILVRRPAGLEGKTCVTPEGTVDVFWEPAMDLHFLTTVTHELRSPLGSIKGFSRLAAQPRYGELSPLRAEFLLKIGRSAEIMAMTVANVALAGSLERGLKPAVELVELEPLVLELVELFATETAAKKLDVSVSCGGCAVRADKSLLRQVLFNLLSNAVRNTSSGGVSVVCSFSGAVSVCVGDTGKGLSSDQLAEARRRFAYLAGQRRGIGLGLYISEHVLKAHGSSLSLDSVVGEGTRASFVLPGQAASRTRLEPLRVVVAGTAPSLVALLEAGGHEVQRVSLGMEALMCVSSCQVVFCRETLPDMGAADLRQALRENPTTAAVPVVLVGESLAGEFSGRVSLEALPSAVDEVLRLAVR